MLYVPMVGMLAVTFSAIVLNVRTNVLAFMAGKGTFLVNGMQLIVACFLIVLGIMVACTCFNKLIKTPYAERDSKSKNQRPQAQHA